MLNLTTQLTTVLNKKVKLSEGLNFIDGNYTKASVDANGVVKYDVTLGKVKDGIDGKPGVDAKMVSQQLKL